MDTDEIPGPRIRLVPDQRPIRFIFFFFRCGGSAAPLLPLLA
jgi:hypothetical protein